MGTQRQEQQTDSTAETAASGQSGKKTRVKDGVKKFRSAADRELAERSKKIAEALGQKAEGGDVSSLKVLVTEALKCESKKGKKRKSKGMAQQLAEGPQWEGPPPRITDEFENWNGDPDAAREKK